MSTAALVERLRARGFTFVVEDRAVRIRPASALTAADRQAIQADLPALVALLAQTDGAGGHSDSTTEHVVAVASREPWDAREAARLMAAADAVVERLGVDGRSPEISQAAARVLSALATQDLESVRIACGEFEIAVRAEADRARQLQPRLTATT